MNRLSREDRATKAGERSGGRGRGWGKRKGGREGGDPLSPVFPRLASLADFPFRPTPTRRPVHRLEATCEIRVRRMRSTRKNYVEN